jgi:hypothetical protein
LVPDVKDYPLDRMMSLNARGQLRQLGDVGRDSSSRVSNVAKIDEDDRGASF